MCLDDLTNELEGFDPDAYINKLVSVSPRNTHIASFRLYQEHAQANVKLKVQL
jgi:hypothetical protein